MAAIWSTESLIDLDAVYSKLAVDGWLALIVPDGSTSRSPAGFISLVPHRIGDVDQPLGVLA